MTYTFFFPEEGHTLAGLIRMEMIPSEKTAIYGCNITDFMVDKPGLKVSCSSKQELIEMIEMCIKKIQEIKSAVIKPDEKL
jgi:DNA-directed RNA polymerase subunit L